MHFLLKEIAVLLIYIILLVSSVSAQRVNYDYYMDVAKKTYWIFSDYYFMPNMQSETIPYFLLTRSDDTNNLYVTQEEVGYTFSTYQTKYTNENDLVFDRYMRDNLFDGEYSTAFNYNTLVNFTLINLYNSMLLTNNYVIGGNSARSYYRYKVIDKSYIINNSLEDSFDNVKNIPEGVDVSSFDWVYSTDEIVTEGGTNYPWMANPLIIDDKVRARLLWYSGNHKIYVYLRSQKLRNFDQTFITDKYPLLLVYPESAQNLSFDINGIVLNLYDRQFQSQIHTNITIIASGITNQLPVQFHTIDSISPSTEGITLKVIYPEMDSPLLFANQRLDRADSIVYYNNYLTRASNIVEEIKCIEATRIDYDTHNYGFTYVGEGSNLADAIANITTNAGVSYYQRNSRYCVMEASKNANNEVDWVKITMSPGITNLTFLNHMDSSRTNYYYYKMNYDVFAKTDIYFSRIRANAFSAMDMNVTSNYYSFLGKTDIINNSWTSTNSSKTICDSAFFCPPEIYAEYARYVADTEVVSRYSYRVGFEFEDFRIFAIRTDEIDEKYK